MNRQQIIALILPLLAVFGVKVYSTPIKFENGMYTNLCGSGLAARFHWCSRECKPEEGYCRGKWVQKTVCDGKLTECGEKESWGQEFKLQGGECGKTVTLNVFDHNCREQGWSCTERNLRDYMVWYSGDCAGVTPTPSPTNKPVPPESPTLTPMPARSPIPTKIPSPTRTPTPTAAILVPSVTPTASPSATPETGYDLGYLTLWLVGVVGLGFGMRKYAKRIVG